jgi:8-oxo-dGTP pyrophosphatase MutT (NUDIX family)
MKRTDSLLAKERIRTLIKQYSPARKDMQKYLPSSVLVPLIEEHNELAILFIKRTNFVKHHKGEISYPGGTKEKRDRNLRVTLFREIKEELGIERDMVDLFGYIDEQITITNFLVRPYVGSLRYPVELKLESYEIADAIPIPIKPLLEQSPHEEIIMRDTTAITLYSYYYQKYTIWGATARILHNFFSILRP